MNDGGTAEERLRNLRHELANPLSAVLAEVQLLLLQEPPLDDETVEAIRRMEELCHRMRDILRQF